MPDDLLMVMAAALATKSAEALMAGGKTVATALVRLIRERFGTRSRAEAAVRSAIVRPDDDGVRTALVDALAEAIARDPAFADEVRARWGSPAPDANINHFSGSASAVVQARDISGDIRF